MWAHFSGHARTFIAFRITLFSEDNVYVVVFSSRQLAIDALSVADIRVMGIDYKCRQADNRALTNAASSCGKAAQNGTVIGNLAVASEGNVFVLSVSLEFMWHVKIDINGDTSRAKIFLCFVLLNLRGFGGYACRAAGIVYRVVLLNRSKWQGTSRNHRCSRNPRLRWFSFQIG